MIRLRTLFSRNFCYEPPRISRFIHFSPVPLTQRTLSEYFKLLWTCWWKEMWPVQDWCDNQLLITSMCVTITCVFHLYCVMHVVCEMYKNKIASVQDSTKEMRKTRIDCVKTRTEKFLNPVILPTTATRIEKNLTNRPKIHSHYSEIPVMREFIQDSFIIHLIFMSISNIVSCLDSILQQLRDVFIDGLSPVRVQKILHRRMIGGFDHAHFSQFLRWTTGRTELTQLWTDKHICLYYMTKTQAYFVRLPQPVHMYSCKSTPFQFLKCFLDAVEVYQVELTKLLETKNDWPAPKPESLIFLFSGGRCGSTLVAKMIQNCSERIYVPSEPPVFDNIGFLARQRFSQTSELLSIAIQFLCRPSEDFDKIFVKFNVFGGTDFANLLLELYPSAKFLYLFRDPMATILSYHKAMFTLPSFYYLKLCLKCRLIFPVFEWCFSLKPNLKSQVIVRSIFPIFRSDFEISAIFWGDARLRYFHQKTLGVKCHEFSFDELVIEPVKLTRRLLEASGLDANFAVEAIKAMGEDSQENTTISRVNVKSKSASKSVRSAEIQKVAKFIELIEQETI